MEIREDDLSGAEVQELIRQHLSAMAEDSPPESVHALDVNGLRRQEVTFWSVWDQGELMGCGALKSWMSDTERSNRCARRRRI